MRYGFEELSHMLDFMKKVDSCHTWKHQESGKDGTDWDMLFEDRMENSLPYSCMNLGGKDELRLYGEEIERAIRIGQVPKSCMNLLRSLAVLVIDPCYDLRMQELELIEQSWKSVRRGIVKAAKLVFQVSSLCLVNWDGARVLSQKREEKAAIKRKLCELCVASAAVMKQRNWAIDLSFLFKEIAQAESKKDNENFRRYLKLLAEHEISTDLLANFEVKRELESNLCYTEMMNPYVKKQLCILADFVQMMNFGDSKEQSEEDEGCFYMEESIPSIGYTKNQKNHIYQHYGSAFGHEFGNVCYFYGWILNTGDGELLGYLLQAEFYSRDSMDFCEGGRFSMYISADLKAMPCSFANQDPFWSVDLRTHSAWDSEIFDRFRRPLAERCPDCKDRLACGGGCPLLDSACLCERREATVQRESEH